MDPYYDLGPLVNGYISTGMERTSVCQVLRWGGEAPYDARAPAPAPAVAINTRLTLTNRWETEYASCSGWCARRDLKADAETPPPPLPTPEADLSLGSLPSNNSKNQTDSKTQEPVLSSKKDPPAKIPFHNFGRANVEPVPASNEETHTHTMQKHTEKSEP